MQRKTIYIVAICILLGLLTVLVLYLGSTQKSNHRYNSFTRVFNTGHIRLSKTLGIHSDAYYLAGVTSRHIYLAHANAPSSLLVTDLRLSDTAQVHIQAQEESLQYQSLKVAVDSPYFYLLDGSIPFIYRGMVTDWQASRYMEDSSYFSKAVPISDHSFAMLGMRAYKNILAKKEISPSYFKLFPDLLEEQIDGLFCTSGMLLYNPESARVVYVYFYRNQFLCMDTTMSLLYSGRTIDPVDTAQIKVARVESDRAFKMAAPPLIVNKASCVSGNRLFINSNILAKNEDKRQFERSSVIDVYNLETGAYELSFYIPRYNDRKLREFRVMGNTLVALQGDFAVTYEFEPGLF
ncbi:hypothetical protein OOZ15_13570 [Galbibacter sp. EGI 63066]|uniref:hypothetical protein n=1 Tax=Galbibacter sp. EGI 63066 TaxID=2993559 RepID=UPI002249903A|nr:hypothetical protein [Galbibacter sp. EGI 63066]MCX2680977.1 hypothetical protein [Galbibacter sp. EGI 63066]